MSNDSRRRRRSTAAIGVALALAACGDDGGAFGDSGPLIEDPEGGAMRTGPCAPGVVAACACTTDREGSQVCAPMGFWLPCQCNLPPATQLEASSFAHRNDTLLLDASATRDPDGDPLTFTWELVSRPPASQSSLRGAGAQVEFVPDHSGEYTVRVTAADPVGPGAPAEKTIDVRNRLPVATTAGSVHAPFGAAFALDASASSDPDSDVLVPTWTVVERPRDSSAAIAAPSSPSATFTPDVPGVYVFELSVFDGEESSERPDTLTVRFHRPIEPLTGLDDVIDAERSAVLDAIVLVSAAPAPRLTLLSLGAAGAPSSSSVALPSAPIAVSVAPDGLSAVVAHSGFLTVVSLSPLALGDTLPIGVPVSDVVADGNGLAYLITTGGGWNHLRTLNLTTGTELIDPDFMGNIYNGTRAKLRPGSTGVVYGADNGVSPSDIERYDLEGSPPVLSYTRDSPFHGDYAVCGDLWFHTSGAHALTACGYLFHTVDDEARDMTFAGQLAGLDGVTLRHADHAGERWVTVLRERRFFDPDEDYVNVYDSPYGNDLHREQPSSPLDGDTSVAWESRFAFIEGSGSRAWVVATGAGSTRPGVGVYAVPLP
jgi:chitinase